VKQAPAWNKVSAAFASNPQVAFGDINLSEQPIRGNHNPGAGGWPTIRYFNKETGYEGHAYDKKTDKSMCDELGDDETMQAYVEEQGATSLCSAATKGGCSEKEGGFIDKWTVKSTESAAAELKRLQGMGAGSMKPELKKWLGARIAILKQLATGDKSEL